MSANCTADALQGCKAAVAASDAIPPDVREKSTLAFAAQGLVRVCGKRAFADQKNEVLAAVHRLLAPGWEKRRT